MRGDQRRGERVGALRAAPRSAVVHLDPQPHDPVWARSLLRREADRARQLCPLTHQPADRPLPLVEGLDVADPGDVKGNVAGTGKQFRQGRLAVDFLLHCLVPRLIPGIAEVQRVDQAEPGSLEHVHVTPLDVQEAHSDREPVEVALDGDLRAQ